MREIKFRGISVKTGEFVYGLLLKNGFHKVYITGFGAYEGTAYPFQRMNELVEEVIPETVGQFTGLKEKNGKEIYEGDIIKTEKGNLQEVVSLIGKFNNKNMTSQFTCFYVGWENMDPSDVIGYYFSDTDEVVGDIHNNPDLLEVSE